MTGYSGDRKTALITGASSGIGREMARLAAIDSYDLLLVARPSAALDQVARELREAYRISVATHEVDLAEPQAATKLWLEIGNPRIDLLVNSAGTGLYGRVWEQDAASLSRMIELNVATLTTLTRLVLPGMLKRHHGRILNVSSLAGVQPAGPMMSAYYATKAYVQSFSRGLGRELKGTGVGVTALCPGPVRTSFASSSGAKETALYTRLPQMTAEKVARAGYRGMKRGSQVVVPGFVNKMLAWAGELPPRRIAIEVNRLLLRDRSGNRHADGNSGRTGYSGEELDIAGQPRY